MTEKRYFIIETANAAKTIKNLWPHFAHVSFIGRGAGGRKFLMQCDKVRETMYEGSGSWQKDHLSKHDERVGKERDEAVLAKVLDCLQYADSDSVSIAYVEEVDA
jgi:hypothetical protein